MPSCSTRYRLFLALCGLLSPALLMIGSSCAGAEPRLPPVAARRVDFAKDVQPILAASCYSCHGEKKRKGDLRLDRKASALGGGVIVPGKSADSLLIQRVAGLDPDTKMPPKGPGLNAEQVGILRAWIDQGAAWPDDADASTTRHWAYQPLRDSPIPAIKDRNWIRTPIDAFVLAKLEAKGLTPSPPADRRTLLRRVSFDLLGLPPTPEEMEAFLADRSPDAYEKVVDRLLASPHYGERWARHWMDVIHFAETHGHDQDVPRDNAWPYRDYLIRSFNEDKPYARFVEEQLAGDVLWPDEPQAIVATGFIAAGPWDESSLRDIREDSIDRRIGQYLDRDDMVTTTMAAFASTTIHCARCHHHKFDPISQKDYYRLQAVFAGVDRADRPYDIDPQTARTRRSLKFRLGISRIGRGGFGLPSALEAQLAALPPQQLVYAGTSDFQPQGSFKPANGCRAVAVLQRGDIKKPVETVGPGALTCLPGLDGRFQLARPDDEGSRRAALAKWLSDPRNALTWRSIVNRVWHYHFGRGIVATPNDFGRMGTEPTHPELLDYLAVRFQGGGGSLKQLHRLIVTSAVYMQSSRPRPDAARVDSDNHYLWRMNRSRLDAESIRDSVLRVTGKLDPIMGGPSIKQFQQSPGIHRTPKVDYQAFDVDRPGSYRRSVYRFLFRTLPDPFMDTLDCPDASQFTPVRSSSVTALQALAMLNDRFMVRQSEHFAARVNQAGPDLGKQIERAYLLALSRLPTAEETTRLAVYANKHGMANVCRLIFNSNEFMFVP
ncbi:MAG TPA: PSD1 and planctomycete cytochrome C domain-containing protein [Gemmataceae bacterium]|nr:PSD1 and planctomycete cytochrome C domain-containing protein [Gemmataceae bacterium]